MTSISTRPPTAVHAVMERGPAALTRDAALRHDSTRGSATRRMSRYAALAAVVLLCSGCRFDALHIHLYSRFDCNVAQSPSAVSSDPRNGQAGGDAFFAGPSPSAAASDTAATDSSSGLPASSDKVTVTVPVEVPAPVYRALQGGALITKDKP